MTTKKIYMYSFLFFVCGAFLLIQGYKMISSPQLFDQVLAVLAGIVAIFTLVACTRLFVTAHYKNTRINDDSKEE